MRISDWSSDVASSDLFLAPVAAFEDREEPSRLTVKWGGGFHVCELGQSPLDVVAWHGNYVPYKYDLRRFCPMNAVRFDHADPSIFTVLTAPSAVPGTANVRSEEHTSELPALMRISYA